ncbi:MAG: hypothetical protein FJ317_00805 [SAR202 cluster bacterium]|nr:hypothetical protein [SAR202 cluster bacterium]
MQDFEQRFQRDKFLVNQRRLSFKEKYYVYDEQNNPLFYVERPPWSWLLGIGRWHIDIFDNDSKANLLVSMRQKHFWEIFHRTYTVTDAQGQPLAELARNNIASLFRRAWDIRATDNDKTWKARENSVLFTIIRRLINLVPYVNAIGGLFRTNFDIYAVGPEGRETQIGSFNRKLSIFDKYVLDLTGDPKRELDRRVGLSLGILMDTAERR